MKRYQKGRFLLTKDNFRGAYNFLSAEEKINKNVQHLKPLKSNTFTILTSCSQIINKDFYVSTI